LLGGVVNGVELVKHLIDIGDGGGDFRCRVAKRGGVSADFIAEVAQPDDLVADTGRVIQVVERHGFGFSIFMG